jgi:hypothetical protein
MNENIKNYASLALDDEQFKHLNSLLQNNKLNRARLFVENCMDEIELEMSISEVNDSAVLETQLNYAKKLEDEIFNLFVEEENDEGKQIKEFVRK